MQIFIDFYTGSILFYVTNKLQEKLFYKFDCLLLGECNKDIYVAVNGTDFPLCGLNNVPCGTIQYGLNFTNNGLN
jgi:hypothetical protein